MRIVARWSAILVLAAVFGFPLYWVATMAVKPGPEWNPAGKVYWVPDQPTLANFEIVLGLRGPDESVFLQQPTRSALIPIRNSLVAASGGTLIALLVGTLAAYGIARFRAGGRLLPFAVLQLRMFPLIVFLIPLFFLFAELGLWDTLAGLALLYGAISFPIVVWMMRAVFRDIPREVSEAAITDGCSHWGAFFKAVLPLATGGLAATGLLVFTLNWSDFLIALVMTDRNATAPVFLNTLQSDEFEREYGPQAALSLILLLPPLTLGLLLRHHLLRGLTLGALGRG